MSITGDNFRFVFWIAVIPAVIAVLLIVFGVQEPVSPRFAKPRRFPIRGTELARLSIEFRWLVGIAKLSWSVKFIRGQFV